MALIKQQSRETGIAMKYDEEWGVWVVRFEPQLGCRFK